MKQNALIKWFVLLILVGTIGCTNESSYKITGDIKNLPDQVVALLKLENRNWTEIAKTNSKNGQFEFAGKVAYPDLYYISFEKGGRLPLFLENSSIMVTSDNNNWESTVIKGSKNHDMYVEINSALKDFDTQEWFLKDRYNAARATNDNIRLDSVATAYKEMGEQQRRLVVERLKNHPDMAAAAFFVYQFNNDIQDVDQLKEIISFFGKSLESTPIFNYFTDRLQKVEQVAIGCMAPEIRLASPKGDTITLSGLKGKYVLIDFWASWCGPCRAEMPKLVKIYKTYHDKNFEILGVSFDDEAEEWNQAIASDGMTWLQVSDLKGWQSAAAKAYLVNLIPHTVLVDPNGVIVAKNLSSKTLEAKLSEILK